jgi:caa(3)-type oxidase subunit IV
MIAFLKNSAHRAWLILMIATLATWYLGEVGAAGTGAIVAMLVIAFIKGRLVILDFMELRDAPRMWRVLLEGWLILVSSLILIAYWISLK